MNGPSSNNEIDFGKVFDKLGNEGVNLIWRFHKKWKLTAEYFIVKSSNTLILDEEFEGADDACQVGVKVIAGFGFDLYRAFFSRIITKRLKFEWGDGLGFHAFESNAFIEAEENLSGDRSVVYAFLPMPNICLYGVYSPTSKWSFSGRLNWFGIK